MKLSLCTITFRHHLVSIKEIAVFARANGFSGVELWGAHARNLSGASIYGAEWIASFGLAVPMISDYLPVDGPEDEVRARAEALCRLAARWGARKVRTFAGAAPSLSVGPEERRRLVEGLRMLCRVAEAHGVALVVETHPNTLADRLASTLQLVEEVAHPALKLNFDVLHVWEGGDDPLRALAALRPHVAHFHLKNVRSRADLRVFDPANVYAAAGRRDGMVPLLEGALDYAPVLAEIAAEPTVEASLEWFGPDCFEVLAKDRREVARLTSASFAAVRAAVM